MGGVGGTGACGIDDSATGMPSVEPVIRRIFLESSLSCSSSHSMELADPSTDLFDISLVRNQ